MVKKIDGGRALAPENFKIAALARTRLGGPAVPHHGVQAGAGLCHHHRARLHAGAGAARRERRRTHRPADRPDPRRRRQGPDRPVRGGGHRATGECGAAPRPRARRLDLSRHRLQRRGDHRQCARIAAGHARSDRRHRGLLTNVRARPMSAAGRWRGSRCCQAATGCWSATISKTGSGSAASSVRPSRDRFCGCWRSAPSAASWWGAACCNAWTP